MDTSVKLEFNYRVLMFTTLIISGCSICYELMISSVSSYLVGDSILQFSITIGLYMCAMGLGSFLSKFVKNNLFDWFALIVIGVGLLGGISCLILFVSNIYVQSYQLVMYIEIIAIGTLVGIEIPILTRIIEENASNLRITLSTIFSFDYIGGLIGSIAFPLLLLPHLGYFSTAFLVGSINLIVSIMILFIYKKYINKLNLLKILSFVSLFIMLAGMLFSENIASSVENGLYRDKIILSKHTSYQHIVVTKHKDDLRLFINGNIQFSSVDEYRYHEALVHIPMSVAKTRKSILILGGGDGLAAKQILKYSDVEKITLVDLDEQMVTLCRENKEISMLNSNSLKNKKLTVINQDAYKYLEATDEKYDVILVDLPDPNDESLNKLYTDLFYRLCGNALDQNGILAVQSTSPYYARNAFWCINKTIESESFNVVPYHIQVPSFGDWGFQLASKNNLDVSKIELAVETKFLNTENLAGLFMFAKDEIADKNKLYTNTLSRPQLIQYYLEAEKNWQ
jgi:spermidine synthase